MQIVSVLFLAAVLALPVVLSFVFKYAGEVDIMTNELFGYVFCIAMTVVLFGIIWGLSKCISVFTDRILPESDDEWSGR